LVEGGGGDSAPRKCSPGHFSPSWGTPDCRIAAEVTESNKQTQVLSRIPRHEKLFPEAENARSRSGWRVSGSSRTPPVIGPVRDLRCTPFTCSNTPSTLISLCVIALPDLIIYVQDGGAITELFTFDDETRRDFLIVLCAAVYVAAIYKWIFRVASPPRFPGPDDANISRRIRHRIIFYAQTRTGFIKTRVLRCTCWHPCWIDKNLFRICAPQCWQHKT
jgi:hypothetical protein